MSKPRKTVSLNKLIEIVNMRNKVSTCSAEIRRGWNSLLEDILLKANNYHGYGYYTNEDLPEYAAPGIRYETNEEDGIKAPCADMEERFRNCDDTRRFYYCK